LQIIKIATEPIWNGYAPYNISDNPSYIEALFEPREGIANRFQAIKPCFMMFDVRVPPRQDI
jgi:hypothetical protein